MSLMGSLYIGQSGLQTGQNALNTTAHNLANANTIGYTRQIVQQAARGYRTLSVSASAVAYQQLGLGVNYSETKTQRDLFLDKAFRKESGRSAFYEVSTTALEEVETLFQEIEGEAFGVALNNLWAAIQDLANEPEQASRQAIFIQRANEFITRAASVYAGMCEYQDNMNRSIANDVERINELGLQISELNVRIGRFEAGGVERANDLRDVRDRLIDELACLADISYADDAWGNVVIKIEGNDFVKTESFNRIALYTDTLTGFYTPYWETLATYYTDEFGEDQVDIRNAKVFNLTAVISSDANTDIGQTKSKMLARGDKRATYEDIAVSDPESPYYDPAQANHYDKNISQSVIMNMQAEFDQLIYKIVTGINEIIREAADAETAIDPNSTYLRDAYGNPLLIFNLGTNDPAYGPAGGPWTVQNIVINDILRQAPSLLGFIKTDGQSDYYPTTARLKDLFDAKIHTLNPNVQTRVNLAGYYNAMISQVANSASVSRAIGENQKMTVNELEQAREQVVGVSSDEELSNMIMFQNAFNASSRYINVISEMLEHIIMRLGNM
ncbi:MAG: flagellar hook-associated protein FlgK [Lachnospiraceae bacterium]|jgi:flagellar hook-associated protein 1 FlgK|nr:flagellar hook-associated protein FlgK [Lachnospiraceae bacterium]